MIFAVRCRGIDGFAHILEMKLGEDSNSEISYYLRRVYDNIRLMDALIGDLLKFSRMSRQQITKQIVDLDILVNDIIAEFRSSDSLDTYSFRIDHLPVCNGDPILIRQVFVNLLSNAIKFSRNRQYAIIEIGADHIDAMNVYFIRDNGIGLDMRYADKIFEVFHRLNPSDTFEGTGLGLAIVKRIIIRHGGKIWVNSEEGTGTTFFFTLGVNHE